ncbi:hypothetical protein [Patulibacter sp. SYSU D01012]|uniref:hypothetical protein n=1 Tax=Patulibacter sp. SYSU D01012 TaxID=2817381 RepID=UPI001B3142CB|nr:hypothetical protein [Patulibacter sp. SYSU D01012]
MRPAGVRRTLTAAALTAAGLTLAGPPTTGAAGPLRAGTSSSPRAAAACPAAGATVARDRHPAVRVFRRAGTLRACLSAPGSPARLRTLGAWAPGTRVAVEAGTVAWTTPRAAGDGVTTIDLRTGRRWAQLRRAVPATATAPAADDRVLALVTDDALTGWVTAGGVVAAALRHVDADDDPSLDGTPAAAVRRRYVLRRADAAAAPALAAGLELTVGGETDDCGGEVVRALTFPAATPPALSRFAYRVDPVQPDPAICSR